MTKFTKIARNENVYAVQLYFACGAERQTINRRSNIKEKLHLKICKFCKENNIKLSDIRDKYTDIDTLTGKEIKIKN